MIYRTGFGLTPSFMNKRLLRLGLYEKSSTERPMEMTRPGRIYSFYTYMILEVPTILLSMLTILLSNLSVIQHMDGLRKIGLTFRYKVNGVRKDLAINVERLLAFFNICFF